MITDKVLQVLDAVFKKLTNAQTIIFILVIALVYATVGATANPHERATIRDAAASVADSSAMRIEALRTDVSVMRAEMNARFDGLEKRTARIESGIDNNRHNNP